MVHDFRQGQGEQGSPSLDFFFFPKGPGPSLELASLRLKSLKIATFCTTNYIINRSGTTLHTSVPSIASSTARIYITALQVRRSHKSTRGSREHRMCSVPTHRPCVQKSAQAPAGSPPPCSCTHSRIPNRSRKFPRPVGREVAVAPRARYRILLRIGPQDTCTWHRTSVQSSRPISRPISP